MATNFWNTSNPLKPVGGPFDPDAILDLPFGVADWLTELNSEYGSHEFITADPFEVISQGTHVDGVIVMRLALITGATYSAGQKYPVTLRIVTANGQQDDQTFYITIKSK